MNIQQYIVTINQRYQAGNATEHSYRGDLQQLLQSLLPDVAITNEPKRIDCGAPDYILSRKDVPVGYIEAKDVGVELGHKAHKEQFDRYRAALDNLIITDYLEFHFYKQGQLVTSCYLAELSNGKIHPNPQNFDQFTNLIQNFALTVTQSIKSPVKLAQMMAAKAKLIKEAINKALDKDDEDKTQSELSNLRNAFKTVLIKDIANEKFADIYAQTIAYGMFAARYHDPTLEDFSREEAAKLIPQSNPFLRQLFRTVAGYNLDDTDGKRLLWIVEELVQIFRAADVASIMQNFGKATKQEDPVIHFYETFLAAYDPVLRKELGVWLTPQPVVNFIVRAVDAILKTKFNLPQGLGDTSKTKIKVKTDKPDKRTNMGYVEIEKEIHKVQILDPATGTGTFLAQVVRHIYANQFASMQGMWPDYVKKDLIPRLNGFELIMPSYAIAHLKLDMLFTETGLTNLTNQDRLNIYLTNSLELDDAPSLPLFNFLSSEANEANRIKRDAPVMVVMGNPPYKGISSNKSKWITDLIDDYKYTDGVHFKERKHWLNNDYVKFIRFGQYFIEKNGEGILAYITPHSFLADPTFRSMRWNLLKAFDEIYTLDLHGHSEKKETAPDGSKDENVFDITQGVTITIFVKTGKKKPNGLGKIFHSEQYGLRNDKYEFLLNNSLKTIAYKELPAEAPNFYFLPKDFANSGTYEAGFQLDALFPNNVTGIVTMGDSFIIADTKQELKARLENFKANEIAVSDLKSQFALGKNYADWVIQNKSKIVLDDNKYVQIAYRPFDTKWTYFDNKLIWRWRFETMKHIASNDNISIVFLRQSTDVNWSTIQLVKSIADNRFHYTNNGIPIQAPLYIYPDSTDLLAETTRTPNLNMQIVSAIAQALGLTFTPEKIPLQNEGVARSDGVAAKLNDLPYNPALRERARELRKAGNLSEVLFWNAVKNKQFDGLDFDRQRVIGNYIVDFYCHERALVVEIDGSSHDAKQEYDAERDAFLKGLGLNVMHVQDIEVKKNLAGVLEMVKLSTATPSLRATPSEEGELKSFAPIDLLDYIYAVLHSPSYRETYKEFLKIDFPRVPYPKDAATFWQLVALGGELRQTHLLEACPATRMDIGLQGMPINYTINYPVSGNNVVDKPIFTPSPSPLSQRARGSVIGKVFINATQYFENVPEIAWNFYIGGYQPAQKWLKDRKTRSLSYEDIAHYQKIIAALVKTHELMQAIDQIKLM